MIQPYTSLRKIGTGTCPEFPHFLVWGGAVLGLCATTYLIGLDPIAGAVTGRSTCCFKQLCFPKIIGHPMLTPFVGDIP